MPWLSGRPGRAVFLTLLAGVSGFAWTAGARAQSAPIFSPTYAASWGSPYKDIYARAFGDAPEATPPAPSAPAGPPLRFKLQAPAATANADSDVVYVIENGRLLTYSAEDYARGTGHALAQAPVPIGAPGAQLPAIADRLYGAPPIDTAAGPARQAGGQAGGQADDQTKQTGPIQLYPPAN